MFCLRREPDLEEVLGDPIVIAVMRRDAVIETTLRNVLADARSRLSIETIAPPEDHSSSARAILAHRVGSQHLARSK